MLEIIPESARIAVFQDETYLGLKGPGIVVQLPLPRRKSVRLSIGDRGRLISLNKARFKDMVVPVSLAEPTTQTDIAIKAFAGSTIVVSGGLESVGPAPVRDDEEASPTRATGRLSPPQFVAALLVMLIFFGAGWGVACYAHTRLSREQTVYRDGIVTTGLVFHKTSSPSSDSPTTYYLAYAFESPRGRITGEVEVDTALWHKAKPGGPIAVRYVPDNPETNLPEGVRFAKRYLFACLFSSVVGLLSTIVIVGIIVNQLRPARG